MVNFDIVISSTSILFLLASIAGSILYPDNPVVHDYAVALFYWFMAVGLVRWIENTVSRLFPKDDNDWKWPRRLVKWAAVSAQLFFFYRGFVFFLSALKP